MLSSQLPKFHTPSQFLAIFEIRYHLGVHEFHVEVCRLLVQHSLLDEAAQSAHVPMQDHYFVLLFLQLFP